MFYWKNRIGCINRIQVTVCCYNLEIDDAIRRALLFKGRHSDHYSFCNYPEKISNEQFAHLRRDAEAFIEIQKKRDRELVWR